MFVSVLLCECVCMCAHVCVFRSLMCFCGCDRYMTDPFDMEGAAARRHMTHIWTGALTHTYTTPALTDEPALLLIIHSHRQRGEAEQRT